VAVTEVTATEATESGSGPRVRTVAAVLDQLRGLILNRELLPGEQIRQEEMARVLGVSRVPLREALRVLASEGLLTHRQHQGYFVAKMSVPNLEQIHTLLEFLETELIRTLRWPSDEELAGLRAINERIMAAARDSDIPTVNQLNRELHAIIFGLSPLDVLRAEAERFWTLSEPYRLLHVAHTDAAIAAGQHEQIIDALAARDRALCLRLSAGHRRETHAAAMTMLRTSGPVVRRLAAG
jgi:DNA-binding GntR family transcriptional regulator